MTPHALLLDASSEILLLLDASTLVIVHASSAAQVQLGYSLASLIGSPIGELECALSDLFFWDDMSASATPLEAPSSYKCFDGSVLEVRKYVSRCGAQGEFYAVRARPMRGAQRTEPELTDIGRHLAATLEATEDCILLTDTDGAILNMNRRFSELWPLPQALLDARDDHGIVAWIDSLLRDAPWPERAATSLDQVISLTTDLVEDTFETLHLKDGRVIECFSHPARNRDRIIGRVFCYRDVTERIQHEASLKEARDKAEQAMKSKSQFLANMSHEIRTPLNAVMGMLKLLRGADLNARQLDYASKATGAAQSLLSLINDVLDFSKMDAGKMTLELQTFELDHLLRDLSVILSANLGKKPVEVLFDVDPTVPRAMVGDAMRLQQVLINLCGNAIKFTAQGEVVLQIKVMVQSDADTTLRIAVKDSGIGIDPQHQKNLFEDFSQAEASTTRRFGGTGLGLSISKRLVALMGGSLQCDSVLGQGSEFYFFVTLATVCQPAPAARAPTDDPANGLRVLMVDDNAVARVLLASMAATLGWQADIACSGQQAINLVEANVATAQEAYQAIFIDWEMPDMDGWQTIARIRQALSQAHTPITVMVTAHDRTALEHRSAQELASLNAYLVKPVTACMMHDVVSAALAGHGNLRTHARSASPRPGQLRGLHLLVVEDNLVNQQVARELLMGEGARVEMADNGALGLAAITRAVHDAPFDAVLMDIQMPVMDGFAATRAIRTELGLDKLPVIAMTANAMASDRDDCLAAGMNDHVGKPFDLNHLVEVLLRLTCHKAH